MSGIATLSENVKAAVMPLTTASVLGEASGIRLSICEVTIKIAPATAKGAA